MKTFKAEKLARLKEAFQSMNKAKQAALLMRQRGGIPDSLIGRALGITTREATVLANAAEKEWERLQEGC